MSGNNFSTAKRAKIAKSEARYRAIVELREQGLTIVQTAEAVGVCVETVRRAERAAGRISGHGLKLRSVPERRERIAELLRQGLSASAISDKLGITTRTVARVKERDGAVKPKRYGSEDEKLRAKMLLVDGCSYAEVARTLGWSDCTIAKWHPGYTFTKQQTGEAAVLARQARRLDRLTLVEKV